jgi:[acyl-carrier-protein] S-malonyltransferase
MLAFIFPGQGSQRPGMGAPWRSHRSWGVVERASDHSGRDVARLLLDADARELRQTNNAQLATFVLGLTLLDAVLERGVAPAAVAGHSLGEYVALVAAGILSFDDGLQLVLERGEAMQVAAEESPGAMMAITGVDDETVDGACRATDRDVWVANYNSPGQVVVSGSHEALGKLKAEMKTLGARAVIPLQVGGAFHTPAMIGARARLRKAIAGACFMDVSIPVVANVDARPHCNGSDWPHLLSAQLCNPVRWRQTLQCLDEAHVTRFVELGPGGVLSGMVNRTLPGAVSVAIASPADVDGLDAVLGQVAPAAEGDHPLGEAFEMCERLVISPARGVFRTARASASAATEGEVLEVGEIVGTVGDEEVHSNFRGWFMGLLAMDGQPVVAGQPLAWLRPV